MTSDISSRTGGIDPAKLSAIRPRLRAFIDRGELAGIVTLTAHGERILQHDALGWSDIERRTPMRRDTLFRIASMTKPITSVAALMLVEEGKLDLNEPVARWIPELANPRVLSDARGPVGATVPAHRAITIEDLLTHRSGIAYEFFSEGPIQSAYAETLGDPSMNRMSSDDWLSALGSLPLSYQPGQRFHYGHSTDVLGFLIGRALGKPFREVLKERIFEPLGMIDTDFWFPEEQRHRIATLYEFSERSGQLVKIETEMYEDPPAYTPGGGGLISSASDYLRFARMLLCGGALGEVRLLQPETVQLMRTNRLSREQRQIPFAGMPLWRKSGFGLGVSIAEDVVDNPYACGAPGSLTWPGVLGTWWQADPVNDLIMIFMIQHRVPVSANSGASIATGAGAAGRRALPVYQRGVYEALRAGEALARGGVVP